MKNNIKNRIQKRLEHGATFEFQELISLGINEKSQSFSALGFGHNQRLLNMKIDIKELKERWLQKDLNYAKRQLTWFKKDKDINWFDISDENFAKEIDNLVKKWQNS